MEYDQSMSGSTGTDASATKAETRTGDPASGLASLGGARNGDWMQTFTGKAFWPLDPRQDEICLEDIAHALAHQCRYAGHCHRFYSVAEHSVLIASAIIQDLRPHYAETDWKAQARIGLMHDAAEAYLVDLPRPVKRSFPDYEAVERTLYVHIAERFGLLHTFVPDSVKLYDNRILLDEQAQLMAPPPMPWGIQGKPLGVTIKGLTPQEAKDAFLGMAAVLGIE